MSQLVIRGLRAAVGSRVILNGIDLEIGSGEVHAVMGPNGAGKSTLSHVLMGRPGYEVLGGTVTLDGADLLSLAPWERAQAGLFLAMQYPTEVPGVSVVDTLRAAELAAVGAGRAVPAGAVEDRLAAEAARVGLESGLLERALNVDLSGGEKKRLETVQLTVLKPRFAILDELDSGLDVDALRAVARRVEDATNADGLGVLVITHYSRLLTELRPDRVHVLAQGRIVASGGPELADELEASGYAGYAEAADGGADAGVGPGSGRPAGDPFADPFADPLA